MACCYGTLSSQIARAIHSRICPGNEGISFQESGGHLPDVILRGLLAEVWNANEPPQGAVRRPVHSLAVHPPIFIFMGDGIWDRPHEVQVSEASSGKNGTMGMDSIGFEPAR